MENEEIIKYLNDWFKKQTKYHKYDGTFEEYQKEDVKHKQLYNTKWKIYILVYFVPPTLALLSFVSIFNLDIGIIFLILTGISWLISEFAIKIWDIGVQKKGK